MARTYRRDSNGRFASGGGGGSAKKSVRTATRGTNRLTRDNAGRITSVGGQGATARGGRLRTAAGNKRGTVVARVKGGGGRLRGGKGGGAGAVPKVSHEFRGNRYVRSNLRPQNTMAKPIKEKNPFQAGIAKMDYAVSAKNDDKKARLSNAQITKAMFESKGLSVKFSSGRTNSTVASYNPATKEIKINRSHVNYVNPAAAAVRQRKRGEISTSSPLHTFYHEMGHARDKNLLLRSGPMGKLWVLATRKGASEQVRYARGGEMQKLSRRVSRYATQNPSEFIAETYAGRRTGRKYDHKVMSAYREASGLPRTSVRKTLTPAKPRRRRR